MNVAGIICEYNPFHNGHARHIAMTRRALGGDCAVIGAMSGNFVQRGDFAVFNKHSRAEASVRCGADLVIEIPAPYALSSANGFAQAGVFLLGSLGVCGIISFGSESGDIGVLKEAAEAIAAPEADALIREWLDRGVPYATAQQKAAEAILGERADLFKSPNNLLGIEYLKAIAASGTALQPLAVKREGGAHDGAAGISAMAMRERLLRGELPWEQTREEAAKVYSDEIEAGRGPVSMDACDIALLSRLRIAEDLSMLPGASEGLDRRIAKYAASEPTVKSVLEKAKTKRYAMSRLRRMLICACLGITADDTKMPPPYIRILAMNGTGMRLLKAARKKAELPIITKPASAQRLQGRAAELFRKESAATDLYVLAYQNEMERSGAQEWRKSPIVM